MNLSSLSDLAKAKAKYKAGTRVELVQMDDPYPKLKKGDKGTVLFVDDAGGVHIQWDNGSTLAALRGVDEIKIT